MIYTPLTKRALVLCFEAHRNQLDKSGMPYVFHPFHLAEQMDDEQSVCVALLHDVMEDTDTTAADLVAAGIPEEYVTTCLLLKHDPSTPYLEYVANLKHDPVARKVKIADLRHNSDITRLPGPPAERDLQRVEKYRQALDLLGAD